MSRRKVTVKVKSLGFAKKVEAQGMGHCPFQKAQDPGGERGNSMEYT